MSSLSSPDLSPCNQCSTLRLMSCLSSPDLSPSNQCSTLRLMSCLSSPDLSLRLMSCLSSPDLSLRLMSCLSSPDLSLRLMSCLSSPDLSLRLVVCHVCPVLTCLHKRFTQDQYYTNAGTTVVAVNPFKDVNHLYTVHQIQAYHRELQVGWAITESCTQCTRYRPLTESCR